LQEQPAVVSPALPAAQGLATAAFGSVQLLHGAQAKPSPK
jgi:hypothetical protein